MRDIPYVNVDTFTEEVLDSDLPVLVQFTAPWCGPCRAMAPILQQVHETLVATRTGKVVKVDVDADPDIAEAYDVASIPSFLLFWDGEVVDRTIGAVGLDGLIDLFARNAEVL